MLGVNLILCCLSYSLQHCAAWCIHFNIVLLGIFTPTLCCLVYSFQHWSNFKRDCTFFYATSVISVLCMCVITIYSSHCFAPYFVVYSTYLMAYRLTWFMLISY